MIGSSPSSEKTLIIIVGPTAIGKTALSIALANHHHCPILSFDSRQFYREMSIGTAKPTPEELRAAEHHFIGNLSVKDHYTAGIYENEALQRLETIFTEKDTCIAVGGSGLYIDALAFGIDDIPSDEKTRDILNKRWKEEGLEVLQQEVLTHDPDFYHESDMQNPRRVMRALEVFMLTGKPYSQYRKKTAKPRPFKMKWIGLEIEREHLFERINTRVDLMMKTGLLKEVKALYPLRIHKALRTVGYTELFTHLDGETTLEYAVERIKRNTRIYAKRQLTWFKKNTNVEWYTPDEALQLIEEK